MIEIKILIWSSLLVIMIRLWTVSYTHLDVYKRQVQHPARMVGVGPICGNGRGADSILYYLKSEIWYCQGRDKRPVRFLKRIQGLIWN